MILSNDAAVDELHHYTTVLLCRTGFILFYQAAVELAAIVLYKLFPNNIFSGGNIITEKDKERQRNTRLSSLFSQPWQIRGPTDSAGRDKSPSFLLIRHFQLCIFLELHLHYLS